MQPEIKTDQRLVHILQSGRLFLRSIDPQRLLASAAPTSLAVDEACSTWTLTVTFPNGTGLVISGVLLSGIPHLRQIDIPRGNGQQQQIKLQTQSKTLLSSLGDLSRIPPQLKQYLSREAKTGGKETISVKLSPMAFLPIAKDAVFFKVEGTDNPAGKSHFSYWRLNYILSEQDETVRAEIHARTRTQTGLITISVETDIYGLGNKKVTLRKKLGADRYFVADCRRISDGREVPSLTVALDLDKAIKNFYPPVQKRERKGMGKPKAGKV